MRVITMKKKGGVCETEYQAAGEKKKMLKHAAKSPRQQSLP
jgi:hypothetical protein